MWYFPESGVAIVMLSNQGNWLTRSTTAMNALVKALLGKRR